MLQRADVAGKVLPVRDMAGAGHLLFLTVTLLSPSPGAAQTAAAQTPAAQTLATQTPAAQKSTQPSDTSATNGFDFSDKPNFSVAGVTDWTAVGGHGSDATLRTSEDLNRETLALRSRAAALAAAPDPDTENRLLAGRAAAPESYASNRDLGRFYMQHGQFTKAVAPLAAAYEHSPSRAEDAYWWALACRETGDLAKAHSIVDAGLKQGDSADLHRLAGQIAEAEGDPVRAVREEEHAVQLAPTEENYLAWGAELLLHRAIWQASQVFATGVAAQPRSARLRTAYGAALFSAAMYEKAAETLCEAATLDPAYREPYLFMGKASLASPVPLPCVQNKLQAFRRAHPDDAEITYYEAMVLLKQTVPPDRDGAEALLRRAVLLQPALAEAHLQLGILAANRKDYTAATDALKKALAADPRLGEAHYRLGVIYDRTGQPERARQEFRLHDAIDAANAAEVERQRKEIKQFVVQREADAKPPAR